MTESRGASRQVLGGLWLLMVLSSFVFVEPAPYDVLMVVLGAWLFAAGMRIPAGLGLPSLLLGLFVLANIVSIIVAAPDSVQSVPRLAFYAALTIYLIVSWAFVASFICVDPHRILAVVWNGYTIAAMVVAVLGIAAYFRWIPGYELFLKLGRAKGTFKDPNVFAPFLIPVLLYLASRFLRPSRNRPIVTIPAMLLLMLAILVAFSRGAWLNLFVSLVVFCFFFLVAEKSMAGRLRFALAGAGLTVLATTTAVWAINTTQIGDLFYKRAVVFQKYDVESGGRFDSQRHALAGVLQHPLGIGPNRSERTLQTPPHNVYIKVTLENGWLGGLALFSFLGLTLWRGFRFCLRATQFRATPVVVLASLTGICVESLFIDTLHWRHFYLLLAILWGTMLSHEREATGLRSREPASGR